MILAGGVGSRISEETTSRPKPMIEIGGRPILWHIMKIYAAHGITEFVICLGYKGYFIKEYFANYYLHASDVTFDLGSGGIEVHEATAEPWRVTLVDTGEGTMTGGRLKRVLPYLGDEDFCFTYGDGVTDLDITELVKYHRQQGTLATVTAVQPPGRFGALETDGDRVTRSSKSRMETAPGSTEASSCCLPRLRTTSMATRQFGSASHSKGWRGSTSCPRTATPGFGR